MSRVALIGENSIGYINVLIDIWNNNNSAVLIDWQFPVPAIKTMLLQANVKECYIEKALLDKMKDIQNDYIKIFSFENINNKAQVVPDYIYKKFQSKYNNTEAVVIYSSGTTGTARGISLSHFAINSNADAIIEYMHPTCDDCIYIVKRLSHSSALIGELLVSLKTGTKIVIAPTITSPKHVLTNIEIFATTILCVTPVLLSIYADEKNMQSYNLTSLKTIYASGDILSYATWQKARKAFSNVNILNVYGLSEAGPRVTAQQNNKNLTNSVGTVISGVEIAIVDANGMLLSANEYGVVHVNTPSIFDGYITGCKEYKSLYKGWLNTGDIGYTDKNGELYIIGRLDNMIIINAHKIHPVQIEESLKHLIDDIYECVVVKCISNGLDALACVYTGRDTIEYWRVWSMLKQSLINYEIPRLFIKVQEIPTNKNGKTDRKEVEKIVANYATEGAL